MKKLLALMVVGGLLALATGCPPAATTEKERTNNAPPPPPPPPPAKETTTMGKILKIDKDKKSITVKDDAGKDVPVMVGADTKITVEGAADKKIDDLKEGQAVTVKSKGDNVLSIEVPKTAPVVVTPPETTTMGKITKIDKEKKSIMVKDDAGKDVPVMIGADTKITVEGAADKKIDDLKEGQAVTVKSKGDTVESIEVPKTAPVVVTPPETTTMGKITKIDKEKKSITVKDDAGKDVPVVIGADTKITLDTKEAKIDDLKEGQAVTVKSKGDNVMSIDAKK